MEKAATGLTVNSKRNRSVGKLARKVGRPMLESSVGEGEEVG